MIFELNKKKENVHCYFREYHTRKISSSAAKKAGFDLISTTFHSYRVILLGVCMIVQHKLLDYWQGNKRYMVGKRLSLQINCNVLSDFVAGRLKAVFFAIGVDFYRIGYQS